MLIMGKLSLRQTDLKNYLHVLPMPETKKTSIFFDVDIYLYKENIHKSISISY